MSAYEEKDSRREQALNEACLAIDILQQAGIRRIVLLFGPVPDPSEQDPLEAVIYVKNLAQSVDAAPKNCN